LLVYGDGGSISLKRQWLMGFGCGEELWVPAAQRWTGGFVPMALPLSSGAAGGGSDGSELSSALFSSPFVHASPADPSRFLVLVFTGLQPAAPSSSSSSSGGGGGGMGLGLEALWGSIEELASSLVAAAAGGAGVSIERLAALSGRITACLAARLARPSASSPAPSASASSSAPLDDAEASRDALLLEALGLEQDKLLLLAVVSLSLARLWQWSLCPAPSAADDLAASYPTAPRAAGRIGADLSRAFAAEGMDHSAVCACQLSMLQSC
jgi:hypothetical protein